MLLSVLVLRCILLGSTGWPNTDHRTDSFFPCESKRLETDNTDAMPARKVAECSNLHNWSSKQEDAVNARLLLVLQRASGQSIGDFDRLNGHWCFVMPAVSSISTLPACPFGRI